MTPKLLLVLPLFLGLTACVEPPPVVEVRTGSWYHEHEHGGAAERISAELQASLDRRAANARADLARMMADPKWRRSIAHCEASPTCSARARLNAAASEPDLGASTGASFETWQAQRQLGWIDEDLGRLQTRFDNY